MILINEKNIFTALIIGLFILIANAGVLQANQEEQENEIKVVEVLLDVGKCRLNFRIIRGSNITILFESGGGSDSRDWNKIAPEVAKRTGATVVTYDRPGFGKSDLPDSPINMVGETKWLFEGLKELDVDKNIILAGHSYGGWLVRLIASMYPEKTLGIVFIDPFTTEFVDQLGVAYLDNHPMGGKLPFDTSKPEKLNKFQKALVRMIGQSVAPKAEIMRKTSIPKGIPIQLITSGKPFLPKTVEQKVWRETHEQLVASIKGAKLIIAENSDHMIPFQQPELIIDTILDVYKQINKEKIE